MSAITVERVPHSGLLVLSAWIDDDWLFTRRYIGYSEREARRQFREALADERGGAR